MTREEREQAISYLETSFVTESNTDGGWSTHHNNVIRTAIKALEQEPTDENLHREREQAYMQGYEDASKRFRQEPNGDVVSRQAVLEIIKSHVLTDDYAAIQALPSVRPQEQMGHWIPVSERLPDNTDPVNITWVNHDPESYYADIKDKPFTATGHYCNGRWWWYSETCQDYLDEYGHCDVDAMDDAIEVIAWMPLPKPYRAESEDKE